MTVSAIEMDERAGRQRYSTDVKPSGVMLELIVDDSGNEGPRPQNIYVRPPYCYNLVANLEGNLADSEELEWYDLAYRSSARWEIENPY